MKIEYVEMTQNDLQMTLNQVKELLLYKLEQEGIPINSQKLSETYAVVVTPKNGLGRLIQKLFGAPDSDKLQFHIVKVISNDQMT